MALPNITGYRLEIVEVPAPKDETQIVLEVLGAVPRTPPPGPPTRMLMITIEGEFPVGETPYQVRIGDQVLGSLAIVGAGTGARGLLQRRPRAGEEVALLFRPPDSPEPQVLVAAAFDPSIVDDTTIA
jgi:hypothetical protein